MSPRALPPALFLLSPGELDQAGAAAFAERVRALERAGLRGILLRESGLSDRAYLELARQLRAALAPERGGWLAVHDRAYMAEAAGADAVHLGQRSLAPREVRPWLAQGIAIGFSSHEGDSRSRFEAADYLMHAPIFAVPSKGQGIGLVGLGRVVEASPLPVWALGGITPENAGQAMAAGARGVAVQRGLLTAVDPVRAVGEYLRALA